MNSETHSARRAAWARRALNGGALAAFTLWLISALVVPALHQLGHRDDHVHLPSGAIVPLGAMAARELPRAPHDEPGDPAPRAHAAHGDARAAPCAEACDAADPCTASRTNPSADAAPRPRAPDRAPIAPPPPRAPHGDGSLAHLSATALALVTAPLAPPTAAPAAPIGDRTLTTDAAPRPRWARPRAARAPPA